MKILIAYDGSPGAEAAVAAAGELFDKDADVTVLSVWEPEVVEAIRLSGFGGPLAVPTNVAEVDADSEKHAQALAAQGAAAAAAAGLEARPAWAADRERIQDAIVDTANQLEVDVIVVGARGLTGIAASLGSVSQHVLQHAHRPVLVVPGPKPS
jgi:nucleotide-binding universal stress UspA family protein